jgi:hypothetical protein
MLMSFTAGFSKDFGMLSSGKEHDAIRDLREVLNLIAVGRAVPWTLNMFSKVPRGKNRVDSFREWCRNELNKRREVSISFLPIRLHVECG